MKFSIPSILLLLSAAHLQALPITGGQFVFVGPFNTADSFTLRGPNFSISGTFSDFVPAPCRPLCGPPGFNADVFFGPDLVSRLQGTVDGVFYPGLSLGNSITGPAGGFSITPDAVPLTGQQLVYTAPFEIAQVGQPTLLLVRGRNYEECVLCGPPYPDGTPRGIPVTGSGQATFELLEDVNNPGFFVLDRAIYEFQIPEPSTFWMLAALIAFGALRRTR